MDEINALKINKVERAVLYRGFPSRAGKDNKRVVGTILLTASHLLFSSQKGQDEVWVRAVSPSSPCPSLIHSTGRRS